MTISIAAKLRALNEILGEDNQGWIVANSLPVVIAHDQDLPTKIATCKYCGGEYKTGQKECQGCGARFVG